jgi:large subunit ribosomal protein L29
MTTKELREKETPQLRHDLLEQRKHLFNLRSQAVTEKLEDPSQLRKTRKDIARILTLLHQRESEQKSQAAASKTPASAK